MPITQFVLEPPMAIDWLHRPISSQIKKDNRKTNSSKLLILNDISIDEMLQEANAKKVDVLLCSTDNCPELMLIPEVVGNNSRLKKLVDSYLKLDLAKQKGFSRGSLMLFLRIMLCASDDTKSYGILKTLKTWFQAPKEEISNLVDKVKINDKYKLPKMEQAIKMFSVNIDYTEGILDFLWNMHGSNARQKGKDISSALNKGNITVVPASIFKENTYFYLLFIYGVISKIEVYIDTDVSFSLVSQYLYNAQNSFSIARYANSDVSDLSFLAAHAKSMLSSAQISNQDLFFSWLALRSGDALKDYSLYEINDLLTRSSYARFVGMYFSLKKDQLSLTQYNLRAERWKTMPFDLRRVREGVLPNDNENKAKQTKPKITPKAENKAQESPNSKAFEAIKANEDQIKEQLNKLISDNNQTLTLLCSKVDSILESINQNKNNAEKSAEAETKAKEVDVEQLKSNLNDILQVLKDLPANLNKKVGQIVESTSSAKVDSDSEISPEQIDKEFEAALNSQNTETTDFDD